MSAAFVFWGRRGCSDVKMTWLLRCAGAATGCTQQLY